MSTPKQLEVAIRIAVNAHFGQTDKAGQPYIFHPLRLMNSLNTIEEKIVAVLHDVVEDTTITFNDLIKEDIPSVAIEALRLLTHEKNVNYEDYIKNISINPIAKNVKIADLKDNCNLSRLNEIQQKDLERVEKYKKALSILS